MERFANWWNSLTPRDQRRAIARVAVVGTALAGSTIVLGVVGAVSFAAEHRDAPNVPEYPRVQEENDSFRVAKLTPSLARITLFNEPAEEEQRDVLWGDIFASLQQDRFKGGMVCWWTLKGKIHDDPPSFLAGCN